MSDKNKNKRNKLPDFLRYQEGAMSGREKNSFEKELQKDPFAEEASEGFDSISSVTVSKDIKHLKKLLKKRIDGKQSNMIYRIAASVAVLMVISSVFIMVEKNRSVTQLSQKTVPSETFEIIKDKPLNIPVPKDESGKATGSVASEKRSETNDQQVVRKSLKNHLAEVKPAMEVTVDQKPENEIKAGKAFVAEKKVSEPLAAMSPDRSNQIIIKGKILSAEDNMPVPGANVLIKGTGKGVITDAEGNFRLALPDSDKLTLVADFIGMESNEFVTKADTQLIVRLHPSVSALSEVVVVGYGVKRAVSEEENTTNSYSPPRPVKGKKDFDKYIRENQHRPDSTTVGQRVVVVVSFVVRTNGIIDSIKVVRSPGKPFSDEAIRLIKSGPPWKPAEDDGKVIEDEVRVRIVFN
jgi:TonB family protein